MTTIDLRSDTVTKPSEKMREAMARAEVGDDVYGEDPSVRELEERTAKLLGKEAALFVPSGTMANQIAIAVHCRPGDEVIVGEDAHVMLYESGAGPALSGVQFRVVGRGGLFTAKDAEAALHPNDHHYAPTGLIEVENTSNRGGGRVFPQREILEIKKLADATKLPMHLDGARLWNAHAATDLALSELAAPFDTVSVCFSKGLGAPVGSIVAGTRAHVDRAHRRRKMLGGGMRQAGILAAAALYALDHNLERVVDDHASARALATRIAETPGFALDLATVETNIVIWELKADYPLDAAQLVKKAKADGVLINAVGARRVRAVTHLDVTLDACLEAAARLSR